MKHIDKVFKDKLFYQTAEVPEDMWDKIAPALEEKSGRALIWFWMAGIVALLLGGLTYLYFGNSDSSTGFPGPLAENTPSEATISNTITEKTALILETETELESKATQTALVSEKIKEVPTKTVASKTSFKKSSTNNIAPSKNEAKSKSLVSKSSQVSSIQDAPEIKYGKPANLVITKSYISDKGSIIEKSKLGSADNEIEYNVFINSEGLNAGTLMRVVEPLENIPLPAFEKMLKKKVVTNL